MALVKIPFKPSRWDFVVADGYDIKGKSNGGVPRAFVYSLPDGKMYIEIDQNKTVQRKDYTISTVANSNDVLIKTDGAKIFMDKYVNADLMKMLDLANIHTSQPFKFKSGNSSNPPRAANVKNSWNDQVGDFNPPPKREPTPNGREFTPNGRHGQQPQPSQSKAQASTTAPPQSNTQAKFLNFLSGGKSLVASGGSGGNEETDQARYARAIVAQNAVERDNEIRKQQNESAKRATQGFAPPKPTPSANQLALLQSAEGLKRTFAGNGVGAGANSRPNLSDGSYAPRQSTGTLNNRGFNPHRPILSTSSWQPMGRVEGMTNLGNTCYMGAITQALFALPKFSRDLQMRLWSSAFEHEQGGAGGLKPEKSVLHQLALIANLKTANTGKPLNLSALKKTVAAHSAMFHGSDQQDAHEFLVALLGRVEDECIMHAKSIQEFLSPATSMNDAGYSRDLLATPGTWSARAGVAADQLVCASSAKTDRSGESTTSPSHGDALIRVRATPASAISAVSSMCNSAISNHVTKALHWDNTDAGAVGAALGSGSEKIGSVNKPTFYIDDDAATDSSFVDSIVSSLATGSDRKRRRSDDSPSTKAGTAIDLSVNSDDDDFSSGPRAAKRASANHSSRTTIEVGQDAEFATLPEASFPGASAVRPLLASLLPTERSFRADVRTQFQCLRCGHHPDPRTEVYSHFQLELTHHNKLNASFTSPAGNQQGGSDTLEQQLENFFSDDVRDLVCEACKAPDAQVKASFRMTTLPGVLVLHLKRFRYEPDLKAYVKVKTPVKFPVSLLLPGAILDDKLRLPYLGQGARMGKTADELKIELLQANEHQLQAAESALHKMVDKSHARYSLRAVVRHEGTSATSGHYICDRHDAEAAAKRGDSKTWLRCNDQMETPVAETSVLTQMESPYVLFYTLDSS